MENADILLSNLDKIHTTEMGIERIRRNLSLKEENVVVWIIEKIKNKNSYIYRQGKNWYIEVEGCRITVNAYSYTIITAHLLKRKWNIHMNQYICTNRSVKYKHEIEKILHNRKREILEFFEKPLETEFNFTIYLYDTIEELALGLEQRGFAKMPDYMCGCHKDEDNSLNFFEPKEYPSKTEWSKTEYEMVIFHEEIHGIQYCIYGTQPEWLTEGIAKYLDGTYKKGMKWLFENYINKIPVPAMKELENEFGWHSYDSYDYAYVMVSYLIETLGKTKFLEVIANKDSLEQISLSLVSDATTYYNNKFIE